MRKPALKENIDKNDDLIETRIIEQLTDGKDNSDYSAAPYCQMIWNLYLQRKKFFLSFAVWLYLF